jgi:hypothetical protein
LPPLLYSFLKLSLAESQWSNCTFFREEEEVIDKPVKRIASL